MKNARTQSAVCRRGIGVGSDQADAPSDGGSRRGGLWHHRDFRRLWVGETVSVFGSRISRLALPLIAILAVHASTLQVGVLTALDTLAFLLVGLPAGAWVDRMRHRRVLIVNDLLRAVALGSIPVAAAFGVLGIGQLYAVSLVAGIGTVFFDVAYQSYLPHLVGRDGLVEGNAKLQATASISQIAGPGAAGLLIQALTGPYAVAVDAVSFLWSASWVSAIRQHEPKPERRPERHLGREVGEGLRFVFGNPVLRAIGLAGMADNLFNAIFTATFYVLLAGQLHVPAGIIGLITSVAAVGGLLGSLIARRIAARIGQRPIIWMSSVVSGVCGFVAPFVHRDWTLALLAAITALGWAGTVVYNITQVSLRQALCPPSLLGRMNATIRFLTWGTLPLGGLLGGALGTWLGVRPALLISAIGSTLAALPLLLSPLPGMRQLPIDESPAEAPAPRSGTQRGPSHWTSVSSRKGAQDLGRLAPPPAGRPPAPPA